MTNYIGKKVIVRADRAGVFYGTLADKQGTEVELHDCRRIWRWRGAASLSQLAADGTNNPNDCMFPTPVESIVVTGAIEIIPCTENAITSIEAVPVWRA